MKEKLSTYSNITGDQLKEKLQKHEGFQLIDVREPEEFASGHITEAINIPMSQFEQNYSTISKDKVVVVICATGARSSAASDYLTQHGYSKVINVSGGISNYTGETVK